MKPSRLPILLSAFVCPGAGQFLQKRWWAGVVYSIGFLGGFCWLLVLAGKIIVDFYRMAFEFETYEPATPNMMAFIPPLALATLFYLVSLFDVVIAQMRISRAEREAVWANEYDS